MKTVIKLAGALLEDDAVVRALARQIAALAQQGHEILVVHGGGRLFTATLKRMGIESNFVAGLRVTNRETRDVAVMVFAGLLNKRLASAISAEGSPAIGISAADASCFRAEPMVHNEVEGSLGFVGYLTGLNNSFLEDGDKVLSAVTWEEIERLVQSHVISGGMVLKLEAAKRALEGGVREVHIVGGGSPDSLLRVSQAVDAASNDPASAIPGTRVLREPLLAAQAALSAA